MTNTWPLQRDCATFYGTPDANGDGVPDRAWEDDNLAWVTPPFTMYLSWDLTKAVKRIRIHKRCAPSLARIYGVIWAHYGCSNEQIQQARMHLFGGSFVYRQSRSGKMLSMHGYACAVDHDSENNPLGRAWRKDAGMMPLEVVKVFEDEGWVWGGRWTKQPDCMHFQAARVS